MDHQTTSDVLYYDYEWNRQLARYAHDRFPRTRRSRSSGVKEASDSSAAAPHAAGADLLVHEVRPNGSRWHSSESRLHLRLISLHLNRSSSASRLQLLLQATNACTDEDRRRGVTEREVRRTTVEQGSW